MVYKLNHRETKHKNGYSFDFRSASKSSVVSSSSDSKDGNEIDVQPNPPKKHYSSSTSKLSSSQDLESGDTTKSGIKLLPGFSDIKLIKNRLHNRLIELCLPNVMKIVTESKKKILIEIRKKLLVCGIEKVDGLLCKLSFRLLSHYICTLSLLMHFVKHSST